MPKEQRFDCGDEGCTECRVCEYLEFLEHGYSLGPEVSVERDPKMDEYLREQGIL